MSEKILEGIRVVEMGTHVAVPFCARELGDLGAEVIKIEPPRGESFRNKMGMLFQLPYETGDDILFNTYNTNKQSLCLNLKDENAREAFLKLLETADVFLTNTRAKALAKLGLSTESLAEKFPSLIIGTVDGYGDVGPQKDLPGYDASAFWGPSGPLQEWTTEGARVFKPFYNFGDSICAAQLTVGILAALYARDHTGKGNLVKLSLLNAGLWHNATGLLRYQVGHKFPKSLYDPIMPLDNYYKTKDGKWFLASEENWPKRRYGYFKAFGTMDLVDDPEWNTQQAYISNIPAKAKFFEEHIAQVTSEELAAALDEVDGVYCFLPETDTIIDNEQAWINGFLVKTTMPSGRELAVPTVPVRFSNQETVTEFAPTGTLGADTEALLESLGYTAEQVAAMAEAGAVVVS